MAASWPCFNCVPEGSPLFGDLTTGPPTHCRGRNDKILPGVIGGYRCSCECNRRERA